MKNFYTIIGTGFIISALFTACSEEIAPPSDNFVVEAFITADDLVDNVKVKMTSPIGSDTIISSPIENAQVTLSRGADEFPLDYDPLTERYAYSSNDLNIFSGEEFDLTVRVGERLAEASTVVPDKPQNLRLTSTAITIPSLRFQFGLREQINDLFFNERIRLNWDAVEGESYFVVVESRATVNDPILPEQIPNEAKELLSSFRFISEPSENPTFEIIGIALETYGTHVAKVFTVNQEYVDLFNSIEQDSRDLNEPASNVNNALGIFTAFATDSIFFEVQRN